MKLAQVGACVIIVEQALATTTWNKKRGACMKDMDGSRAQGVAGTDYVRHEKLTVDNLEHCRTLCQTWPEVSAKPDQECHALEYVAGDSFDYCEFWLVEPLGASGADSHKCEKKNADGETFTEHAGGCRVDAANADKGTAGTHFVRIDMYNGGDNPVPHGDRKMVANAGRCRQLCDTWDEDHENDETPTMCHGVEIKEAEDEKATDSGVKLRHCLVWTVDAEGDDAEEDSEAVEKISCEKREREGAASPEIGAKKTTDEMDASAAWTTRACFGAAGSAMLAMGTL